jgi:hypothetical protein
MLRRAGSIVAAAVLAAVTGCTPGSFLVALQGGNGKQQVVAGSVDQVSANLQAALGRLGISATATRQGEGDIRLSGVTKKGKQFYLVLKRKQTDAGERTAISVEWADGADEEFWLSVVQLFTAPPPSVNQSSAHTPSPNAFSR